MLAFDSYVDDFYCNMNLNTEMAAAGSRETILGFFERVQKTYPTMRNFYTREIGRLRPRRRQGPGPSPLGHRSSRSEFAAATSTRRDIDTAVEQHSWCWNCCRTCFRSARSTARRSTS